MQTCNESLNQPGFKLNPNLFVATRIQRRLRSALYAATFRTSSSPATFASVRTPITAIAASFDPTASSTTRGASRSSRQSQGNSSRRGHTSLRPQVRVYCSSQSSQWRWCILYSCWFISRIHATSCSPFFGIRILSFSILFKDINPFALQNPLYSQG